MATAADLNSLQNIIRNISESNKNIQDTNKGILDVVDKAFNEKGVLGREGNIITLLTRQVTAVEKIANWNEKDGNIKNLMSSKKSTANIKKHTAKISKDISSLLGVVKKLSKNKKTTISKDRRQESSSNAKGITKGLHNITDILEEISNRLKKGLKKGIRNSELSKSSFKRGGGEPKREKKGGLGELNLLIGVASKLKDISFKDIRQAKRKVKRLKAILENAREMFKMFKSNKEIEDTLGLVNSSNDLVEKLIKYNLTSVLSQGGVKSLNTLYFGKTGKGGLVGIFHKLEKNEKTITNAKKRVSDIKSICGEMIVSSLALGALAVVSPAAIVGSLALAAITATLTLTFKLINSQSRSITKGRRTLRGLGMSILLFSLGMLAASKVFKKVTFKDIALLSGSIVMVGAAIGAVGLGATFVKKGSLALVATGIGLASFGLGFGVLRKATKGMTLKDTGIISATLVASGLAVAGVGLLAVPIALGSASLLLMGLSIGVFGLALRSWQKFDSKSAIGNLEVAVGGLKRIFGLDLGKREDEGKVSGLKHLGKGLVNMAAGFIEFGGSLATLGTVLMTAGALGALKKGLQPWEDYSGEKAISNLQKTISGLKNAFGKENKEENKEFKENSKSIKNALRPVRGILWTMSIIRHHLKKWDDYNASGALSNIKNAIISLKTAFSEEIISKDERKDLKSDAKGLKKALKPVRKLLHTLNALKRGLTGWEKVDTSKSIQKIKSTILELSNTFNKGFMTNKEERQMKKSVKNTDDALGPVKKLLKTLKKLKRGLKGWEKVDTSKSIQKVKSTILELASVFNTELITKDDKKNVKDTNNAIGPVKNLLNTMNALKRKLKDWEEYNGVNAVKNVQATVNEVSGLIRSVGNESSIKDIAKFELFAAGVGTGLLVLSKSFSKAKGLDSDVITSLNANLKRWTPDSVANAQSLKKSVSTINKAFRSMNLKDFRKKSNAMSRLFWNMSKTKISSSLTSKPLNEAVNAVNAIDLSKATVVTNMFNSFAKLNTKRSSDAFKKSIEKFTKACKELADAINNAEFNGNPSEQASTSTAQGVQTTAQTPQNQTSQVQNTVTISNLDQLAEILEQKLRSMRVNMNPGSIDVNLVAEGGMGKTVKLTIQD